MMSGYKNWNAKEAASSETPIGKTVVSKTPRVDACVGKVIIVPGQFVHNLMLLARELEKEADKFKLLACPPSAAAIVEKKKKTQNGSINPYVELDSDEVMHRLRQFGFGSNYIKNLGCEETSELRSVEVIK